MQGIFTSKLIPNGQDEDALGSCVFNATTSALAADYNAAGKKLPAGVTGTDARTDQVFAIKLYHATTTETGDPASEWEPTDCGSTGYDVCKELIRQRLIKNYRTGGSSLQLASLLQTGTVIIGMPWFSAAMQPDQNGFIDGDGSKEAVEALVQSGVAGGHETHVYAMPQVGLVSGHFVPSKTVFRVRNSWDAQWGQDGDYLVHGSTIDALAGYADLKQFVL